MNVRLIVNCVQTGLRLQCPCGHRALQSSAVMSSPANSRRVVPLLVVSSDASFWHGNYCASKYVRLCPENGTAVLDAHFPRPSLGRAPLRLVGEGSFAARTVQSCRPAPPPSPSPPSRPQATVSGATVFVGNNQPAPRRVLFAILRQAAEGSLEEPSTCNQRWTSVYKHVVTSSLGPTQQRPTGTQCATQTRVTTRPPRPG